MDRGHARDGRWWLAAGLTLAIAAAGALGPAAAEMEENPAWEGLKREHFGDQSIAMNEEQDVVALDVPFRAQDPAMMPMTVEDRTGAERRITDLWLVVDENPMPVAAHFRFGEAAADATLSSRIRVNAYSFVRAIARTDDGELHMAREHVRASGGCAAPVSGSDDNPDIGEMRFQTAETGRSDGALEGHLRVRHPMVTGLQMDQVSRLYPSPHFLEHMEVTYGGETLLEADLTFTFSRNPSWRFHFTPRDEEAEMVFRFRDTEALEFDDAFAVGGRPETDDLAGR